VSRWHTTWGAVVPTALRGLLVAGFFGFARAVGETMAVQMVAGNGRYAPLAALRPAGARLTENVCAHLGGLELFRPTSTISTRIVMDMPETQPGTPWNNALFSMSLVLLLASTLVVLITRRVSRPVAT
jgi:phosphate transport system permease protein